MYEHQTQLYFLITAVEICLQHTARRCGTWVRVVSDYVRSCVEVIISEWKSSSQHSYSQHYTNVSVQLHISRFTSARAATNNYWVWDWVGCRSSLGAMKTSYSDGNWTPNPWSSSPQYSHYIHLWSLVRNLRVQEPENNVKSDRKPCTVATCVRV
jgi:hypothetical protein